jgi:Protein of unknown function (DUF1538)
MSSLAELGWGALRETILAVLPIAAILIFFQVVVIRRRVAHLGGVLLGFGMVVLGMALFLTGLEESLFPLGKLMAGQLTDPEVVGSTPGQAPQWQDYGWVYAFGAAIGFATTVAEPALIAVSLKAQEVSAGTIGSWGLRMAVAAGVAVGIAVGCFRIVTGTPLPAYIIGGYILVLIQASRAPRGILALAFDTGGVTTSTVTVPLVAALGLGLASTIPGRSVLIDGFGLIASASLFPMMTVMGYAQVGQWRASRRTSNTPRET